MMCGLQHPHSSLSAASFTCFSLVTSVLVTLYLQGSPRMNREERTHFQKSGQKLKADPNSRPQAACISIWWHSIILNFSSYISAPRSLCFSLWKFLIWCNHFYVLYLPLLSWALLPKVCIYRRKGARKHHSLKCYHQDGKGRGIRWDLANVLRCVSFLTSRWTSEQGCNCRNSMWCVF